MRWHLGDVSKQPKHANKWNQKPEREVNFWFVSEPVCDHWLVGWCILCLICDRNSGFGSIQWQWVKEQPKMPEYKTLNSRVTLCLSWSMTCAWFVACDSRWIVFFATATGQKWLQIVKSETINSRELVNDQAVNKWNYLQQSDIVPDLLPAIPADLCFWQVGPSLCTTSYCTTSDLRPTPDIEGIPLQIR